MVPPAHLHALCSPDAIAYTARGFCYQLSQGENTVRIYNSLFDTTFHGTSGFCLPKLPLDSLDGVYVASHDTIFCPAAFIAACDDYIDRPLLQSFFNR